MRVRKKRKRRKSLPPSHSVLDIRRLAVLSSTPALGFPGGSDIKQSTCNARDLGSIPWRRAWQPTPVFLPGEPHGQGSLVGYSPRGCKESAMAERLSTALPRRVTPCRLLRKKEKRKMSAAKAKMGPFCGSKSSLTPRLKQLPLQLGEL